MLEAFCRNDQALANSISVVRLWPFDVASVKGCAKHSSWHHLCPMERNRHHRHRDSWLARLQTSALPRSAGGNRHNHSWGDHRESHWQASLNKKWVAWRTRALLHLISAQSANPAVHRCDLGCAEGALHPH